MIDEELQLHSWREVLDYRVKSLLGGIAQERDWLLKAGATEYEIREALRHQYEILHKIYSEDYPDTDTHEDVISVL